MNELLRLASPESNPGDVQLRLPHMVECNPLTIISDGLLRLASPESNQVTCDLRLPHLVDTNQKNSSPKIALAFWGLTRSLKYTIKSIKKNILNIFKEANIEYDIFIHTYDILNKYTNNRSGEKNIKLDCSEYKLLNPTKFQIQNQGNVKNKLDLLKYRTHPDPWKTNYETMDNFILAMYSKMKVTELIQKENEGNEISKYKYIIFLRPDVKYLNNFDLSFLNQINDNSICIPNFALYSSFNDRFCLANYNNGILYGTLFKYMLEYSKKNKLHSETFNNHYMRNFYKLNIILIPFYFNRVRANGIETKDAKV